MYKIDLHTHSSASPDGGITAAEYATALHTGQLDYIAVTDHNRIDFALSLQQELGSRIIVGEEINAIGGEIIGLFLTIPIQPGLTPLQTAEAIKAQGGLVYIPHPFETVRSGLKNADLAAIAELVDIMEVFNGRAVFQNRSSRAASWAAANHKAGAAGSDAHGAKGLGTAYSTVASEPNAYNLTELLGGASINTSHPPLLTLLYPKMNRLKKRWGAKA